MNLAMPAEIRNDRELSSTTFNFATKRYATVSQGFMMLGSEFAHAFRRAIDYVRAEPGPIGLWPVSYLCFSVLHNMCESALLTKGTFPFLVFALVTTTVAVNRRRFLVSVPLAAESRRHRKSLQRAADEVQDIKMPVLKTKRLVFC